MTSSSYAKVSFRCTGGLPIQFLRYIVSRTFVTSTCCRRKICQIGWWVQKGNWEWVILVQKKLQQQSNHLLSTLDEANASHPSYVGTEYGVDTEGGNNVAFALYRARGTANI